MVNEIDRKIFEFAYSMALRDAVLQKAYKGMNKKTLLDNKEAAVIVEKYIQGVFKGEDPDFYTTEEAVERYFKVFIEDNNLMTESGTPAAFTFGNTQKLVNMTAKYMFLSAYNDSKKKALFNCCHCPMDGIMIEKVISEIDKLKDIDKVALCEKSVLKSVKPDMYLSNGWRQLLRVPWSQITLDDHRIYDEFQMIVRFLSDKEGLIPVEYDFIHWAE